MQAGAVYIKFFVYLLVYVYLYTQFQKSRAPWSVEFQWNSLSNLQKNFPFLLILIPYLAHSKYCKIKHLNFSSVNWDN